jgi:hypothetical protein
MGKNSAEQGYALVVTINYDPGSFNLIIDRFVGDVSPEGGGGSTTDATGNAGNADNAGGSGGTGSTSTGSTETLKTQKFFDIFDSGYYHLSMTNYDADGSAMPVELYVDAPMASFVSEVEGAPYRLVLRDNKQYSIFDDDKTMMVSNLTQSLTEVTMSGKGRSFDSSGTSEFYDGSYYYETFSVDDGSKEMYFHNLDTDALIGVRNIDASGTQTDMVFTKLDKNVPANTFVIPKNYKKIE